MALQKGEPVVKDTEVKPLWSFRCEDEVRGTPAIEGGVLYVGSYDNNLYALNSTSGDMWKFPTEGGIVSQPLLHEGVVYVGSADRHFYAISARTGEILVGV